MATKSDTAPSSIQIPDAQVATMGGPVSPKLGSESVSRSSTIIINGKATPSGGAEKQNGADASLDPLSQHIFKRTNTMGALPNKLRSGTEGGPLLNGNAAADAQQEAKIATEVPRSETFAGLTARDKKKGVSFLSRFMSGKKKGGIFDVAEEDGSESENSRLNGGDPQLFSQSVDNLGFSPKYPLPASYVKMKLKNKKEREFEHVFLAQELQVAKLARVDTPAMSDLSRIDSGKSSGGGSNPIWALEFSKDGKYLAAGGQDKVVRVWVVLSTSEERRVQEREMEAERRGSGDGIKHLIAPVFQKFPHRLYEGHTSTILDLSWSKNNFLLSSSMDKTVRLWHTSRTECLCTFKHADIIPSIQFHPRDDRFFLAGSLDSKLRLWSIPDKSVAYWSQVPDMITSVAFTPDGKTAIAGTLTGLCLFYETEGLKYQTQIHVRSAHGKNAKGSKITGIQAMAVPANAGNGEVKLLISSNDSRIRMYNFRDKSLETKFRGHENNCSQIRATFSDDMKYVVCGSEDSKTFLFSTGPSEGDKRNMQPSEVFEANAGMTTCSILAPTKTRQILSGSEDPVYDICNPPPVTLVDRTESHASSRPPTENGSVQVTPTGAEGGTFRRFEESPAYLARTNHTDGNIIVTANNFGCIKVFRQDCARSKRLRLDSWDTSSIFSKKVGSRSSIIIGRSNSIATRNSGRGRRDSLSTQPSSDRILSWRQDMLSNGSLNGLRNTRSMSPRKSLGAVSTASSSRANINLTATPPIRPQVLHEPSDSMPNLHTNATQQGIFKEKPRPANLSVGNTPDLRAPEQGKTQTDKDEGNKVWSKGSRQWSDLNQGGLMISQPDGSGNGSSAGGGSLAPPRSDRPASKTGSEDSRLTSELSEDEADSDGGAGASCKKCGGTAFKVKAEGLMRRERLVCARCSTPIP